VKIAKCKFRSIFFLYTPLAPPQGAAPHTLGTTALYDSKRKVQNAFKAVVQNLLGNHQIILNWLMSF
jgi:hypothetical protein